MNKSIIFSLLLAGVSFAGMAQEKVRVADQMYKKTVVRALDLRERQNKPLFAKNREITKFLMEAVESGKIKAYKNDSLTSQLDIEEFKKRLEMPSTEPLLDTQTAMIMDPDNWRDLIKENGTPDYYFAWDLYQLELKENLIFDKQKSQMTYDIEALTVYIPADHTSNLKGIQEPLASFNYKELKQLFQDNPNAIHVNDQNDSQHKNLADAFELRLFSSYIIKVSNADDAYIADKYSDQNTGIMASQWAAHELLEYEHHLWEF